MSKFTPAFLDQIRDNLTLSDLLRGRIKLTRAGREFKGCCPFHNEKTPSFYVNDDKQFYHCFGCGAHGDAIRFLVDHDNMRFPEAVEQLADKAGVPMPIQNQTAADFHREQQRKGLYELLDDASNWFCRQLYTPENRVFLDYLAGRGISRDMLSGFMIGCAPVDQHALPKFLKAEGYDDDQMIESGLCRASKKGGALYSFFRERVMFPVLNRKGSPVTFGGRILPDHIRAAAGFPPHGANFTPPKYINGSDSPLFNKSQTLYGEYQARKAAREGHTPIVVEGYLDVIACHDAGFKGAVAPMGTALTPEQITVLWQMGARIEKTPILCFDGDKAGQRAAERALDRILPGVSAGKTAKFAFMPEGEDPDSLIKAKGAAALKSVFRQSMSLVDYLWDIQTRTVASKTPEERAGVERALNDAVEMIEDASTKNYYQRDIRDRLYKHFSSFKAKGSNKKNQNWQQDKQNEAARSAVIQTKAANNVSGTQDGLIETLQTILLLGAIRYYPLLERFYDVMERRYFRQSNFEHLKLYVLDVDVEDFKESMPSLREGLLSGGYGDVLTRLENSNLQMHAPWLGAAGEEHEAIDGWDAIVDRLNALSYQGALSAARNALEQDFTEENAKRLAELQRQGQSGTD
jgi:DNA primase